MKYIINQAWRDDKNAQLPQNLQIQVSTLADGREYINDSTITFIDENSSTGIDWAAAIVGLDIIHEPSDESEIIPYINDTNIKFDHSETKDIQITGGYFTETTKVTINGQTVNSIQYINNHTLAVNVTSGSIDGFYTLTVDNGQGTASNNLFEVKLSVWVDLRLGGDTLTDGNGAGNDIRYRSGMSLTRTATGMQFSGSNPWSSWVKFERDTFLRENNDKLSWIIKQPISSAMVGIGSDQTNELSNAQYQEMETLTYFSSSNIIWGLYGNNGIVGTTGSQGLTINTSPYPYLKLVFENSGSKGGQFSVYGLNSASSVTDWDDTTNLINTFVIGGTLDPSQTNLMPCLVPRVGDEYIAYKIN